MLVSYYECHEELKLWSSWCGFMQMQEASKPSRKGLVILDVQSYNEKASSKLAKLCMVIPITSVFPQG